MAGGEPSALVERARAQYAQGYRAFKLQVPRTVEPILDEEAVAATEADVRAVREAFGPDVQIMVDCHGKLTAPFAHRLAEVLVPYRLLFYEEPILPYNVAVLAHFAHACPLAVATGERLYNRWSFREVIEQQAAQILQPDVGHAGILETKRIAAMGETYHLFVAPHNPRGPGVTMASLHIAAYTPNFLIQEVSHPEGELWDAMLVEPLHLDDGYVRLPTAPGLGLRFDEALAVRFPYRPRDSAHPTHADGSVADW